MLTAGSRSGDDVVLLIHAFPLHAEMWRPQLSAPPRGWRLLAVDLKGFAPGTAATGIDRLTMDMLADDVAAQLREAGTDRVVVCGLSMGGYVAFSLLRRWPQMVRALVLCDTRAGADSADARKARIENARGVREHGTGELVRDMAKKLVAPASRKRLPDLGERVRGIMDAVAPATVSAALLGMAERADSTAMLGSIRVPTLVMVGAKDTITPPDEARAMAGAIPNAKLEIIEDAAHLPNLEQPQAFNRALAGFLKTLKR